MLAISLRDPPEFKLKQGIVNPSPLFPRRSHGAQVVALLPLSFTMTPPHVATRPPILSSTTSTLHPWCDCCLSWKAEGSSSSSFPPSSPPISCRDSTTSLQGATTMAGSPTSIMLAPLHRPSSSCVSDHAPLESFYYLKDHPDDAH